MASMKRDSINRGLESVGQDIISLENLQHGEPDVERLNVKICEGYKGKQSTRSAKKPLFSIIIANYNYGRFLQTAIASVLDQSCQDFELIVVDGGSTDSSLEIIRKVEDRLAWWCSEKDHGQSDAFNKGFMHAQGRFGCWLNADDIMMPNALAEVRRFVEANPNAKWIGGSMVYCSPDMCVLRCSRCTRVSSKLHRYLPGPIVNGPSSFFTLEDLWAVGAFDVNLHYTMDIDLWKRLFIHGSKLYHVKSYLWAFRVHDGSKTSNQLFGKVVEPVLVESSATTAKYWSRQQVVCGEILLRFLKIVSGAYLWSIIDTLRYKNRPVQEIRSV